MRVETFTFNTQDEGPQVRARYGENDACAYNAEAENCVHR